MKFPFDDFTVDFIFSKKINFDGKQSFVHSISQSQETRKFKFQHQQKFKLIDIKIKDMSVKEHVTKSTRILENASIRKNIFEQAYETLELNVHESEWIPFVGPFTRWNKVGDPSSGESGVFYHITWFGHSRPSKNVVVHGKQFISHDLKILDKWMMQKRIEGIPGQVRCRVFFMPPWEYLD